MKLGHQAPLGTRQTRFNSILIDDLHYCASHQFVFDPEEEEQKLYNAEPCIYTDTRFVESIHNSYGQGYIYHHRRCSISLKACIRRIRKVRNIPVGTLVHFRTSWYYPEKKIDPSYIFKVRKENRFEPNYEINLPSYEYVFSSDPWANDLVASLRTNGFIVSVYPNTSFLLGMMNTAVSLLGGECVDSNIPGEIAIAYGYGKKIGFSSGENDFRGYIIGEKNVLWDTFDEFDKWSRCNTIPKDLPVQDIVDILRSK